VSCRVLVDATNIRAGHGLWSWLDAVSDDDTASVKRWHFNSKFNWLALVISRHETGMSLTCTFQAERNSPHEIQPNGEVGYDIKTAAARVSSRLTDFCMKRFSLRYSENKGFTRADIYETFGEFSKMVPVHVHQAGSLGGGVLQRHLHQRPRCNNSSASKLPRLAA
jgi:hypothetical protein